MSPTIMLTLLAEGESVVASSVSDGKHYLVAEFDEHGYVRDIFFKRQWLYKPFHYVYVLDILSFFIRNNTILFDPTSHSLKFTITYSL